MARSVRSGGGDARSGPARIPGAGSASAVGSLPAAAWALLAPAFLGAALVVYGPALRGPFVSDDLHYVADNPFVHELSLENVLHVLDPAGPATVLVVNYTPLHGILHMLAWSAFGPETLGHHVSNVVLHALASLLLVALLLRVGVPRAGAVLGGAFFLLHPANVEAVAWISQLKTSSSMVLTLATLLVFPRRPVLATAFFALALLAKPQAAVALPVAGLLSWTRDGRVPWAWLGVWSALFAGYAVAEFAVHQRSGAAEAVLHETPLALLRTIAALAARYLVMASTSIGVSAFHEPEPALSWLDAWWLASLVPLALLCWRSWVVLRRRDPEVAFWVWALVSFGPVSQVFPFLYPLADRYLYFILPGLLGGALLLLRDAHERLPAWLPDGADADGRARRLGARIAVAAGIAACALFAVRSHGRAEIWRSPALLVADAAAHYPHGVSANLLRAKRAAQLGDVDGVVAGIRAAAARGYNRFEQLLSDPGFAPVREHPKFRAVVNEIAAGWIERGRRKVDPTQGELRRIASAHAVRGEYDEAAVALRRALALGGPLDAYIRADLAAIGRRVED